VTLAAGTRLGPYAIVIRFHLLLVVGLSACGGKAPPGIESVPAVSRSEVRHSLFLIGDGGKPKAGGDPVLQALSEEIQSAPGEATVVFLGDNIYSRGLPEASSSKRTEMERRLKDQIDAVLRTNADGIVVPGNHDWDNSGGDGWNAVLRQGEFIAQHGDSGRVRLVPEAGCPGPSVIDVTDVVRVVALDTQWWLHSNDKPGPGDCEPGTEATVLDALRVALSGDRIEIVVGHHPLVSSGPHGGYFTWQDHLFPLTRVVHGLWIPLPIIGSGYPLARLAGVSSQDMSGSRNERMRAALEGVFAETPPLVFVGGHEHTLEVLEGEVVPYLLTSGAGYYGHTSPAKWRPQTLYQNEASGFMRLDLLEDGRLRLGVIEVSADAARSEHFSLYLENDGAALPR